MLLAVCVGVIFGTLLGGGALVLTVVNSAPPEHTARAQIPPTTTATLASPILPITPAPLAPRPTTPVPTALRPTPLATRASLDVTAIQPGAALRGVKHDYQHWNNCGPTTLEMDLSFFGRTDTQAEIAAFTKPNPDDRNVRPDELAAYAQRAGLKTLIGENGTVDRLKWLLSNGVPVIVETAMVKAPQGWMGHYRLLIGYDATQFNTMDSYEGANVKIKFDDLDAEWRAFNRLYLVVYPDTQAARIRTIAPDAFDPSTMYTNAVTRARAEIEKNPNDAFAQFNLGSSLVGLKQSAQAATAFDRARALGLPSRMLWYQFGPYEAYLNSNRPNDVIALADATLNGTDDLEESHYYKGLALRALKRETDARHEFETALQWNKNYRAAQIALTTP